MKKIFAIAFFLLILGGRAFGGDLTFEDGAIRVRGLLRTADIPKFNALLADTRTEKVVFGDSLGGTAEAAMAYAQVIRSAKLKTEVKGKCFSACAIAFVAGSDRTFSSGLQVDMLIFHMGRTEKGGVITEYAKNDELFALLDKLTGEKLREPVRSLIKNSWSADTGVLFSSEPGLFGRRTKSLHCDGTQGLDGNKCKKLDDSGPLELGIVTKL